MPQTSTPTTSGRTSPRRWLALAVIAIAQLMVVLDATIVNIALPAAETDLGFSDANRQWVVTAYSLAFGSLLLLGGRLSDLFGRKATFLVGLVGFALASTLGGLAPTFGVLVAARALQGVFAALLAPAALSLLTTTFTTPKERNQAFGVFGAVAASGGGVGLLLGGALTEYASWRWCLFVNLIFAAIAFVGAALLIPRSTRGARPRIDLPGVATITVGLVGIVYAFSSAETDGWDAPTTIASLGVGVLLIIAFVLIERRTSHPLLPLRIVLDRDRGGSLLVLALAGIGMFGVFLFLTYYLESTLRYSALQTGFAFIAMPLSIIVSSNLIGSPLLPRVGPRILVVVGALSAAAGLLLLLRTELDSPYVTVVLPALVLLGLGLGLIFSCTIAISTLGVDTQDSGVASATVNTVQQIGGSIGTALLSTVYSGVVAAYLADQGGSTTQSVQSEAVLQGYHVAFGISAGVMIAAAVAGGLLIQRFGAVQQRMTAASRADSRPVPMH